MKGRGGWRSTSKRREEGIPMMIGEEREFSWLLEMSHFFLCVSE
jgi:hypothetical protein